MDSIDNLLMSQTSRLFMNAVEKHAAEYMNTKWAVYWFCDSSKSELYKIDINPWDGKDGIIMRHMAQKGICGYVANTH